MVHDVKCWVEPFQEIKAGRKRHEIRKNDRSYKVGDFLRLREWDPEKAVYTGAMVEVYVTYMSSGGSFGLPDNLVVMSIVPEDTCSFVAAKTGDDALEDAFLGTTETTAREAEKYIRDSESIFRISFSEFGTSVSMAPAIADYGAIRKPDNGGAK